MKEFASEIASQLDFPRPDLIEKDIRLHSLLKFISDSDLFSDDYLFKGGTCLIKAYFGYYRFSEDIDLTFHGPDIGELSQTGLRKKLSVRIDHLAEELKRFTVDNGYDFEPEKGNERYIQLGGSNKFVTFKLHYTAQTTKLPSFIKLQINFLEKLLFTPKKASLRSLSTEMNSSDIGVSFPQEYMQYSTPITLGIYDIEEIFCEKARSILTRRGIKARDFIDMFKIQKEFGLTLRGSGDNIIEKTLFMLEKYDKYKENLRGKIDLLEDAEMFNWSYEKGLLLEEISEDDIFNYVKENMNDLIDIVEEIQSKTN